jgi:hypothetical protein
MTSTNVLLPIATPAPPQQSPTVVQSLKETLRNLPRAIGIALGLRFPTNPVGYLTAHEALLTQGNQAQAARQGLPTPARPPLAREISANAFAFAFSRATSQAVPLVLLQRFAYLSGGKKANDVIPFPPVLPIPSDPPFPVPTIPGRYAGPSSANMAPNRLLFA